MGAFLGKQKLQLDPEMERGGSVDQDLLRQMATQNSSEPSPTRSASLSVKGPSYSLPMPEDRSGGLDELVDKLPDPDAMSPDDENLELETRADALDKLYDGKKAVAKNSPSPRKGKLDFDKPGFSEEVSRSLDPRGPQTGSYEEYLSDRAAEGAIDDEYDPSDPHAGPIPDDRGNEIGSTFTAEDGSIMFVPESGPNEGLPVSIPDGLEGKALIAWAMRHVQGPGGGHGEGSDAGPSAAYGADINPERRSVSNGQPHPLTGDHVDREARMRLLRKGYFDRNQSR